ncbi:MAG TPA: hypothetical protein VGI58_02725 [Streptosporangiaceae bacterium]|jgi:hypothetical protein
MKDLSVLTPPFLVCAAVVVAIVAFLRHEMGRGRQDDSDRGADISEAAQITDEQRDDQPAPDDDRSAAP